MGYYNDRIFTLIFPRRFFMVKKNNDDQFGTKRLQSKNARNAIIQRLSEDFNLTPIIAEAFYSQFSQYYQEFANVTLSTGEIVYEAVSAEEPAGKHIRFTRKKSVRLKLIDFNTDLEVLANSGTSGLRQHRLARITKQAYEQGGLLSYEDVATILTTSPSTVKRDVHKLNREGMFIVTRGTKLDMGPGVSHKTTIIDYYLKGYTFTEIEVKTNHSETSVKRYLADFIQIVSLYRQDFKINQIRLISQKSQRIVREYLDLYKIYDSQGNEKLDSLINPQCIGKDAKKKSLPAKSRGGERNE